MVTRIGVVGFGFCGNLLLAHLMRQSACALEVYVVDPHGEGVGVAYGTREQNHLLNVRAASMSAFPEAPDHFMQWAQRHAPAIAPQDFAPRATYGMYLRDIWEETQALARAHDHQIKLVLSTAVAINPRGDGFSLVTARGDAIAVDRVVLATGNDIKPITPPVPLPPTTPVQQQPYAQDDVGGPWQTGQPVLVLGTGLSAADMVMARPATYAMPLYVRSRHGRWPQAHAEAVSAPIEWRADAIPTRLLPLLRWLRVQARSAADWRHVVDALRPHTQAIWQRFSTQEQRQFMRHLAGFWSIHRHRMPPQAAQAIARDCAQGSVAMQPALDALTPGAIINCTGWQLDLARSTQPIFKQLLDQGMIERHDNGLGLRADPSHRAWGQAYPHLYAMGNLLAGQLLESTAVPELRVQAHTIAEALCASISNR